MTAFYLDNNATTRVLPAVLEAMLPWFSKQYGNPSSHNQLGQYAKSALVTARSAVAALIGASPAEIIFTGSATESNHTAILGVLGNHPEKHRIVTSAVEHSATLRLLESLSRQGYEIIKVPVNARGELDMGALAAAVNMDTVLVTLMHANNETGVIFPVQEVAAFASAHGAIFHIDAAQTVGRVAVDVQQLGCDFLSFSGHKLHAPKGVGVLYARKGQPLKPLLYGHQERNRRGGTENLPSIVGLGIACQLAREALADDMLRMSELRDLLEKRITAQLPFVTVNGQAARIPNTSSLCFNGLHGEEMLHRLDQAGVIVSQGSACTAGGTEPSHVLTALGLDKEDALSTIRFSLSRETTAAEIEQVVETVTTIARAISPTHRMAA